MADKLTLWDNERNIKCDVRIYRNWKLTRPDNLEDVVPWKPDYDALAEFVEARSTQPIGAVRLRLESDEFIIRCYVESMFDTWYEPDFVFYSFEHPFRIEVKDVK